MRKITLFPLFILVFLLSAGQDVFAQAGTFKSRVKQSPPQNFRPQNLAGTFCTPGLTRPVQTSQAGAFQPRSFPYSALSIQSLHLDNILFDANGQLIFTSGVIPGATRVDQKSAGPPEACYQYLEAIKTALGIQDPREEMILERSHTDELGMTHFRMQQVYRGIPVWGAEAYLHSNGQYISMFNGRLYPTPRLAATMPSIPTANAIQKVVDDISARTEFSPLTPEEQAILNYASPISELVIYHKDYKPENAVLAWHVTIRPNFIEVWEYFVNAVTGDIIHQYNNTRTDGDVTASGVDLNGVNQTFHAYLEGGTYYLADASKSMFNPQSFEGVLQIYDAGNTYPGNNNFSASPVTSANNTWEPTAVSAMVHSSLTWDYFKGLNRNSYNNQGGSIRSIIHVGGETGGGLDNAFWNGQAVIYGDGETYYKPLAGGLDVCAHEHGHAYEGSGSNLEYQNQSGAMSETYADIAGSMVDREDWELGEDVVHIQYYPTGCLRNMSDPHNGGSGLNDMGWQPAHTNEMYTGTEDNGGVHINSGIGNFAYYKCATAIGKDKAEQIFWRASFNYLTRTSQFADFRVACLQSAKDLYGDGSAEMNATATAFDEVGITGEGGGGGGGGGGGAPGNLPVNPGPDYILAYDVATGDPNSLYITATDASDYFPISQTEVNNRPSILDDGSLAVFIDSGHKMRRITLSEQPSEDIIQNEAIWDGVAVHKLGNLVAAVTIYQDSSIWVYSYDKSEWMQYYLYNPGTEPGMETFNVLYADAMEFDYTGQYLLYDAFSNIESGTGQPLEFWDVNFIKVWDNATNDWGDGSILKLFTGLPEGISIGNPSFSKNSTHIAAFDMLDSQTNTDYIMAINMNDGSGGVILENGDLLGTPNYSKLDDKLIFTTWYDGHSDIAWIGMKEDKVTPEGDPTAFLVDGKWAIWFSQGTRPLAVEERAGGGLVKVYPNPARDRVIVSIEKLSNENVNVTVYDLRGIQVLTYNTTSQGSLVPVDLSGLTPGLYFLQVQGEGFTVTTKVMKR